MFKHCVIVFLVSMVPLIELRGAIPYGVVYDLPLWLTYIIAIAGNMLPVPFILLFIKAILGWMSRCRVKLFNKIAGWLYRKAEKNRAKVERIREVMPDAFIGVDVIVGTRGETAEYFEEAYQFIDSLDISQLHVFSYSERPGTKALDIPHVVTPQEKHARSQRLIALSERKHSEFCQRFVGTERPVLWEHAREGQPMQGFTDNYVRVELPAGHTALDNTITRITLTDFVR